MSGLSISFSLPIEVVAGAAAAEAIMRNDETPLKRYVPDNPNCFATASRNNWLEYHVHLLIDGFKPVGLSYLSRNFGGRDHPLEGWFAVSLHGPELRQAVAGLRSVIADVDNDLAATAKIFNEVCIPREHVRLLETNPSSIGDAVERYDLSRRANEGEDMPSMIAFLQAHLAVLEFAAGRSMAALYAVCLN